MATASPTAAPSKPANSPSRRSPVLYAVQTLAYGLFLLLCAGACAAVMAIFERIGPKVFLVTIGCAGLGTLTLLLGLFQLAMALFFHGSARSRVISLSVAVAVVTTGAVATTILLRGRSLSVDDLTSIVGKSDRDTRAWLVMGRLGLRREHRGNDCWEWPEKGITVYSDYECITRIYLQVASDAGGMAYQGKLPADLAAGDRVEQIAAKLGPLPEYTPYLSTEHDKIYEYPNQGIAVRLCEGELKSVLLIIKRTPTADDSSASAQLGAQ
jgi:hypothetical protein